METVTLYATAPSVEAARRLARELLARRLVACANLVPAESLYWWEGKVEEAREVVLFLKTTRERADAAVAALAAAHEHDVPCAVVLPHVGGHEPYRDWIAKETR